MVKRVLIFSTDDFLHPAGGAEVAIWEIAKRNPDISFALVCGKLRKKASKFDQVGNVEIHRMGFGIPKIDGFILALFGHQCAIKLHKKTPFDISWAVMASYGAFAALKFKKISNVPYLLTLQEGDSLKTIEHKTRLVKNKFGAIFVEADGLSAISSYLLEWGGLDMKSNAKYKKIIPNGVDLKVFTSEIYGDQIEKLRKSFGFAENVKILITSSRLEHKNGIDDVLDALKLLPQNICFVICGGGSLESELKKRVSKLGLDNRVRFLGFVERERLPTLFKSSDIFIRPSLSEGLGNAFLEAMAAGIPIIGTPVGGIPDFLQNGVTGFFCKPNNPQSVSEAIQKVLNLSSEEKYKIITTAQNLVKDKYDWDKIGNDMRNMFECVYENSVEHSKNS